MTKIPNYTLEDLTLVTRHLGKKFMKKILKNFHPKIFKTLQLVNFQKILFQNLP